MLRLPIAHGEGNYHAPPDLLAQLQDEERVVFPYCDPDGTVTAEANPNSLTAETAREWREIGVNRLSLGVQSFDDRALAWLGRLHDGRQAREAVERARDAGFDELSLDLIFGLPDGVSRCWRSDLQQAVGMGVSHLSIYGLTAEPGTPLGREVARGQVSLSDADVSNFN